jgi:hypothetical protein
MTRLAELQKQNSFSTKLKRRLASLYLDSAEKLPTFHGTVIAVLQNIRKHQHERAQRGLERAHLPEGTEVTYPSLRMFELFPLEEYAQMEQGLRSLFPQRNWGRDFLDDFRETAKNLNSRANSLIGYLLSKPPQPIGFGLFPNRVLGSLPVEVESATVRVFKVLPSLFTVCIDVKLTDAVTAQLKDLQSRPYLPEVVFKRWIPWDRYLAGGYSESPEDAARERVLVDWLTHLRGRIEAAIRPYIHGYFCAGQESDIPSLPAIEVFTLRGVPTDDDGFDAWQKKAQGGLSTLGAPPEAFRFDGFRRSDLILLLGKEGRFSNVPYRAFSLASAATDREADERRESVLGYILDAVLPSLVLSEFLERIQDHIEVLREAVYIQLRGKARTRHFRRDVKLHQRLQRESMLVSRFQVEMEESETLLAVEQHELETFHSLYPEETRRSLSDALINHVKFQAHTIGKHVTLASQLFAEHLSWRNLDVTYRLQRRMLFLTYVVLLATVVSLVVPNWAFLKDFVASLVRFAKGL